MPENRLSKSAKAQKTRADARESRCMVGIKIKSDEGKSASQTLTDRKKSKTGNLKNPSASINDHGDKETAKNAGKH